MMMKLQQSPILTLPLPLGQIHLMLVLLPRPMVRKVSRFILMQLVMQTHLRARQAMLLVTPILQQTPAIPSK